MNKMIYFLIMIFFIISNIVIMPNYDAPPVGTPISSIPYIISSPGKYYLTQDFINVSPGGNKAIHIQVSNVELDGNGYILDGTDSSTETGIAVFNGTSPTYITTNVTIRNIILTDWGTTGYAGILFNRVTYSKITNVTAYSNGIGIRLQYYSVQNYMANNSIHNNTKYGFELWETSSTNTLENNTANHNALAGFKLGFPAYPSDNNILKDNVAMYNNNGFWLEPSSSNTIKSNKISNNNVNGIIISSSSYSNTIRKNTIESNPYGIRFTTSANYNYIYHNNFIGNTDNADDAMSDNYWYEPNDDEGNYWDDYNGIDGNSDGIGDTPYNVTGSIQDLYPYMNQWGWLPTPTTIYVDDDYTDSTTGWNYNHFNRIQDAINVSADNVDINVYNGTYNETLLIDKPLNLTGEGINTIIQPGITPQAGVYDINLAPGSSNTIIRDFVFDFNGISGNRGGTGFVISDLNQPAVTNVEIKNNIIYTGDGAGVGGTGIQTGKYSDVGGLIISGNAFYGDISGMGEGVYINPFSGSGIVEIFDNEFYGNLFSGVSIEANNTYVANNVIDSNASKGIYGVRFIDLTDGQTYSGVEISNNSILNCTYGIRIGTTTDVGSNLTAEISSNNITYNDVGIWVRYGANLINSVHFNNIFNNTDYGINNVGSSIVNATKNWWGSISGPYHSVNNINGSGDNVSDNVDFNPWIGLNEGIIYSTDVQINQTSGGDVEDTIDVMDLADLMIFVNTSTSINITVVNYSTNPENIPVGIQAFGKYIDIEVENWSAINPPINITIYYTQDDLNNSDLTEDLIHGIYFWNGTSSNWELFNNTGVNTTDQFNDYIGYCWANVWHLTPIISGGGETNLPSNITGLTVTDAKDGKLDLSWNSATDDTGVDYYNIYRDYSGSPIATVNHPTTTYQDSGLTNGQTYWYEISAVDVFSNEGNKSDPVSGKPTKKSTSGGTGGGTYTPPNQPPIADASKGEPYDGFVGIPLTFDGSLSSDSDGNITSWLWDFGDNLDGAGEKTTHIYYGERGFNVILTVIDEDGAEDTYETIATITQPNRPPSKPTIDGPAYGEINTSYSFEIKSTDADNDNIKYTIEWGDGLSDTTDYYGSGISLDIQHSWDTAGVYIIKVKASDEQSTSETTIKTILIDSEELRDFGYLLDTDNDGVFDTFQNETTGQKTAIEFVDGDYLLDDDGDGEWDYKYNEVDGLSTFSDEEEETPGLEFLLIIISLLIISLLLWYRKK